TFDRFVTTQLSYPRRSQRTNDSSSRAIFATLTRRPSPSSIARDAGADGSDDPQLYVGAGTGFIRAIAIALALAQGAGRPHDIL
ncbi:MAG: hypothetical protein ACI9KE_002775, partial [Polyangiales bacterium]